MKPPPSAEAGASTQGKEEILELSDEHIAVSRRTIEGDTVRVESLTQTRPHSVEEELAHEAVEIEHVPIGRVVEIAPGIRQEGDVTILPIMEEVLVLERRLVLKEEVRIRRVRTTAIHRETVQLRTQVAIVTRSKAGASAADGEFLSSQFPASESETS